MAGYLVAGFPGALLASAINFLPCYLLTILPAPYFKRIAIDKSIKAFVYGITAAVIGALVGIGLRTIIDIPTALIALAMMSILIYFRKVKEPYLIIAAAIAGLTLRGIL